jgi:hypothetical protein
MIAIFHSASACQKPSSATVTSRRVLRHCGGPDFVALSA